MPQGKARLVIFEEQGLPQDYVLKSRTRFWKSTMPVPESDQHLYLDLVYLDNMQGTFDKEFDKWYYANQGDHTKTTVNGKPLDKDDRVVLQSGDIIQIKNEKILTLVFFQLSLSQTDWQTISLEDSSKMVYIHPASPVGILDEADLVSHEFEDERYHGRIRYQGNQWIVEDINTENGIYINQEKLVGIKPLTKLDVIRIDSTLFIVQDSQIVYNHTILKQNELSVDIKERTVSNFFKKFTLLKDIKLTINSGEMILLLGGSGAGKTTFVNAITGYEKANATILQGDKNIYENYRDMKYEIGFVPQQDLLRLNDTVYMTLKDAAKMRMSTHISKEQKEQRIAQVLHQFGLTDLKDELVGKLSGGQRKRLSIGIEFISDPTLFILDEPDSGLDGVMARDLMESLRQIANENRIVIVITHTPDRVIDLFDKVIVLAKDTQEHVGRLAYYGSIPKARDFFERKTMEGIVESINSKEEGGLGLSDTFIEKYQQWKKEGKV